MPNSITCGRRTYTLLLAIFLISLFILFSGTFVLSSPQYSPKAVQDSGKKIDPDLQFEFAEHCFREEDYFRAIGEYKRLIYFCPEDRRVEMALFNIGMCYYSSRQFISAVESFQAVIKKYEDTDLSVKSYFMISRSYMKRGDLAPAVANLQNLIALQNDSFITDQAYYEMGWFYLEAPWFDGAFEKARRYFSKVSTDGRKRYPVEDVLAGLNITGTGIKGGVPQKNPMLAGALSVIPGAGYLYCERYRDAFIAFVLNCGLILAAYESFDDENYALGSVITFFEFGFYTGNIYGAVTSAHKYNRDKASDFTKDLKRDVNIGFNTKIGKDSIAFCVNYSF